MYIYCIYHNYAESHNMTKSCPSRCPLRSHKHTYDTTHTSHDKIIETHKDTKKNTHIQTIKHSYYHTSSCLELLPNHHVSWLHLCAKLPAFLWMTKPSPQCHTTRKTVKLDFPSAHRPQDKHSHYILSKQVSWFPQGRRVQRYQI